MSRKCALIVDDSRTAREVLARMLERQQLRVETAGSAEEALEYLSAHRPDVIFMDHLMPGMDGFEAVRAIKNNPATATIPVMMYTSQSGELYVGQARALGAVGVLPKQIKPVEVTEVLRSLHLVPDGQPAAAAPEAAPEDEPAAAAPELPAVDAALAPGNWADLHQWLAEMLAEHGRNLRADIESSVARLLREQRAAELPVVIPPVKRWPLAILIGTLALCALTFLLLHLDSQAKWQTAAQQNLRLMSALNARRAAEARAGLSGPDRNNEGQAADETGREVLAALEWTVNQAAGYPPDELPLGDERLAALSGLVEDLRAIGFAGVIRIESHVGDFCMTRGADETLSIAPDELPLTECERLRLPAPEARELSARQSVAFANYLAEIASSAPAGVRVELVASGNERPREAYPVFAEGATAGDWNRVAAANNRVEFRLLPDAGDGA